ncbi:MAG TPA: NUDIX hydrolase [Methylomirabilota bacterium]|nr:NUDIX hydrolase [Methylomirabilota bacterium]
MPKGRKSAPRDPSKKPSAAVGSERTSGDGSATGKKRAPKRRPRALRRQVAALPFRRTGNDSVEVLIMTSRETRRFVIPKGWPMKKRRKNEAAAIEAFEEAGVRGTIGKKPLGRYTYWKRLKETFTLVRVVVYPLEVVESLEDWPERDERLVSWLKPADAALLVDEPGLAKIIREVG